MRKRWVVCLILLGVLGIVVAANADIAQTQNFAKYLKYLNNGECEPIINTEVYYYDKDNRRVLVMKMSTQRDYWVSGLEEVILLVAGYDKLDKACLVSGLKTNSAWSVIFFPSQRDKTKFEKAISDAVQKFEKETNHSLPTPVYKGKLEKQ